MREFNRVPRGLRATKRTIAQVTCDLTGELTDGQSKISLRDGKSQADLVVTRVVLQRFLHLALHGLSWWRVEGVYAFQLSLLPSGGVEVQM